MMRLRFMPCANPYDIVHLPGFEFGISHPERVYREALLARFPQQASTIAHWFESCEAARRSALTAVRVARHAALDGLGVEPVARCGGGTLGTPHAGRGAGARSPTRRLRAVLGARWADYGAPPAEAPFAMHALVTGAYNGGAYYPVGGPARFAQALVPVIEAAGGELRRWLRRAAHRHRRRPRQRRRIRAQRQSASPRRPGTSSPTWA